MVETRVRRARLSDAQAIAAFVNASRANSPTEPSQWYPRLAVTASDVADRFSQVGFMIAEIEQDIVGLLGWQIEDFVVRVTDFLLRSVADPISIGKLLIARMEAEAVDLQAEAVILFLPPDPSPNLVTYWERLGYAFEHLAALPQPWREAVVERGRHATHDVLVKRLRETYTQHPL